MQQIDHSNILFDLATKLVNHTSRNIFLTGKAGTGKTTFLKYIRENCPKQMAIVAPTGVAAINAGGVTIHSFFQLPIAPFIPEAKHFDKRNDEVVNSHSLMSRMRLNRQKKQVLQELELLIIDEISMVRCDVLDAIDTVLRHVRHNFQERFGGVQVLFIGDMFQLPPVTRDQEWNFLSNFYTSPYFFDSWVIKGEDLVYIEFNKIYRQTEEKFISLLNQVRNNKLDENGLQILQQRFQPNFSQEDHEGFIVLTTHNEKARELNAQRLSRLKGKLYSYSAEVKDEFPGSAYPADQELLLKEGAQVMFIKNDPEKRYFNGKLGIISELNEESIFVECEGEGLPIEVKPEIWENIKYTLNPSSRQLEEEVLGSFVQYPLRLAWAITIHKSQGLTFPRAVIDAGRAFAPGQVYVALSRCSSLDGLVLKSQVNTIRLMTDQRIVDFSSRAASSDQLDIEFKKASKHHLLKTLESIFDIRKWSGEFSELVEYLVQQKKSFNKEVFSWVDEANNLMGNILSVSDKFRVQLHSIFSQEIDGKSLLNQRVSAAFKYFTNELDKLMELMQSTPAVTDSRMHAREFNELLKNIYIGLAMHKHLMQNNKNGFDMEAYHKSRQTFKAPSFKVNVYAATSHQSSVLQNPELYRQLKSLRDQICAKRDLPVYMVASSKTLEEMATYLPRTLDELNMISGFGKAKSASYGKQFLDLISAYCEENNIESRIQEINTSRKKKETYSARGNTKMESFNLFRKGMTIPEIATERKLSISTIETHLLHFISSGEVLLDELVDPSKIELILPLLDDFEVPGIAPIKERLGDAISYSEIRAVIAWKKAKKLPAV